jgi:hypothetical protein
MRLTSPTGDVLGLTIAGYQFPDEHSREAARERANKAGISGGSLAPRNPHDDNWLMIRGRVEAPLGSWDFLEPCLETWEVRELVGWLRAASRGEARGTLGFLEPVIEFESATPTSGGSAMKVVVNFRLEGRPPWVAHGTDDGAPVDFLFSLADLDEAASELERELAQYPER